MGKIASIILSVALASAVAFAQDGEAPAAKAAKIGVGARAAFDYGMIYGMDEEDEDMDGSPSGIGFDVGAMLRVGIANNFYFAPEVNFAYIKTEHKYLNSTRRYTRMDLEIPLLLRGVVMDRFYGTFGPQLNLNLSNKVKAEAAGMDSPEDFDQAFLDFGLAVGAGVRIIDRLFFDFRVYMGLTELFPDVDYLFDDDFTKNFAESTGWSSVDMSGAKTLKFKFGISYWFI